jgi:hypothetical protein
VRYISVRGVCSFWEGYLVAMGLYIQVRSGACFLIFLTSSGTALQSPPQRATSSDWM